MIRLPRLPVNYQNHPGLFERYWDEAMKSIEDTFRSVALLNSYVVNASAVLSVTSAGLVTIASHTREYGDGSSVSVAGDTLATGVSTANSVLRIYYQDPTLSGGAVTYEFTTDPDPQPYQKSGVHVVGTCVVPAAGTVDGYSLDPWSSIYF